MRKIILIFMILLFGLTTSAETLKASVSEIKVPNGFWGNWRVVSEIYKSNNASIFNPKSIDVWGLSGVGNILILDNPLTGAYSEIKMDEKNIQGKTLKFTRTKTQILGDIIVKHIESPEITLNGDTFTGFDTFIVEKYKNNTLLSKDMVIYKVSGEKISGNNDRR